MFRISFYIYRVNSEGLNLALTLTTSYYNKTDAQVVPDNCSLKVRHCLFNCRNTDQQSIRAFPLAVLARRVKPCSADLQFHYYTKPHSRWTLSGVGPRRAGPTSKGRNDVRGDSSSFRFISAIFVVLGERIKLVRCDSFTATQNTVTHRQTVVMPIRADIRCFCSSSNYI